MMSLKLVALAVFVLMQVGSASGRTAGRTGTSSTSQLWPNNGTGWDPATSRLQDFTNVGYQSGAVPIPDNWPIGVDVTQPPYNAIPNDGLDDSQAFLDALADCPDFHAVYVPNGVYTISSQRITVNRDHVVLRGQDMYQTILDFPKYLNEIYIQEVGYENPAFDDGSNGARHTGTPKGFFRVEGGTERSIENFTFRFRNQRKMGHWEHKGASAISYSDGVTDSWVRNIYVLNGDHGIMIGYSFRLSILNVVLDHTIDRPDIIGSGPVHRWVGHMGIAAHNSRYSLFHNVHFTGDYFHELDNANVPNHCVFSNFTGPRVSLHHHGGGSNNNLYTHASVGAGPGINSLGSTQSNETHWNILGDKTLDLPTSMANMENFHVFVAYDGHTSALSLDANGDYITNGAWWETIDPSIILPQNIYFAQMAHLLKPLPSAAPPAPPSHFTGNVIRLNPVEDTVTDLGDPDTPQNPLSKSLMVGDDMYFKFDLTSLSLNSIHKVRFRVASDKFINTPVGLSVYSIPSDTWSADTITYNSAPLTMSELGTILVDEDSFAQILEFDVTSFVQAEWASNDKVVSLVLKRTSGNGFLSGIRSREMGIAPELIIEQVPSVVAGPPSAPQNVRSYSMIGNVLLDWDDNSEADVATYNVYRSTSSTEFRLYEEPIAMALVSSDFVDVQDQHKTGWDIGMMRDDTVYYYRVTAVDAHGYESESSLEIVGTAKGYMDNNLPPSFDSGLVTLPAATQYLSYSGSLVSSATDPEGDPLYFSKVNGPDWLSVSDDGTVSGTPRLGDTGTFQFDVQVNSLGSGRDEATIEITVTPGPPDAPPIVDTTPGDASAELDWWHDSEGSSGFSFAVYRSTDAGSPYTLVSAGLTASTFTDLGLSNGVTYYYVVTASNTFGESPFSSEDFVIPVQGLAIATNFLGGDMNGATNWSAGLPVGQWAHIEVDGTVEPSDTTGYAIVQTGGRIHNSDFLGTSFSSTEWHLHGGELETRGLSLKDSSSFHVNGNGVADLGNNNKDCGVYSGSSFIVGGGTVTFGRHMRINGGTFTVTGGITTGSSNTDFGVANFQGSATMNFNGGTSTVNRLDLRGGNSDLNLGGSAVGSLTASSFVDVVFGTNTFINVLPETRMSLTVSAEDEWAEAKWAAGDLTYDGQGAAQLGAWASVTSTDGLDTGVHFQYDSVTETLTLFTASLPPLPPQALSATPGDEESSLVWELVNEPDVTGYKVYRATTSGGPYTLRATLGVTAAYLDTGLQNGVTYFYVVTAVDASTNESDQSTEALATPIEPNVDPVFTTDPVVEAAAVEDVAYSSSLADDATDANPADTLSFRKVGGPAWLSIASNGDLSGTPDNTDVGLNSFTVEVSDGKGGIDTAALEISVLNTNDAPMFTDDPFTSSNATEDTAYSSNISGAAMDPDVGDVLSYSKIAGPAWLIVASNGGLSGTPEKMLA